MIESEEKTGISILFLKFNATMGRNRMTYEQDYRYVNAYGPFSLERQIWQIKQTKQTELLYLEGARSIIPLITSWIRASVAFV
jgi:hypothetical protein